jgi:hypothetical protein
VQEVTDTTEMVVMQADLCEFGLAPATSFILQASAIRVTFSHEDHT